MICRNLFDTTEGNMALVAYGGWNISTRSGRFGDIAVQLPSSRHRGSASSTCMEARSILREAMGKLFAAITGIVCSTMAITAAKASIFIASRIVTMLDVNNTKHRPSPSFRCVGG